MESSYHVQTLLGLNLVAGSYWVDAEDYAYHAICSFGQSISGLLPGRFREETSGQCRSGMSN
jgi:hypothetical protein